MTIKRIAVSVASFFLLLCVGLLPAPAQQIASVGRSATSLPDGRTLITGGLDAKSNVTNSAQIVSADGSVTTLTAGMNSARAGHTATVLPDGTVLIFGGVGDDGKIIGTTELFDPTTQTFSVLQDVFAVSRAFHTATLLTDGTVLLAGGVLAGGEFPDDVQLYDYRSKIAISQHAVLAFPREGHDAELLSDGTVRISGGTDHFGKRAVIREIYDPITKRFRFSSDSTTQADEDTVIPIRISDSIPKNGANDVAIQNPISVRFSHLLTYASVNAQNFVLVGPNEATVAATITPAENGRLVFVLPNSPLQAGTDYTLQLKNVVDKSGNQLPDTSISFQTEGEPQNNSNVDWVPGPGWRTGTGSSKWQELAPLQAGPNVTALAGQVLKINGWPLEHVTLVMDGKKAQTDSTGRFLIKGLTAGRHVLWIDATSANRANATYGVYEVGVNVLPNRTNALNYTIWMTRLDMAHAVNVPSPTGVETVLTNPAMPGLELHIPAGTTITDHHGKVVRQISITPVPLDKTPFPLPAGVNVPIYFTIQPGGAYLSVASYKVGLKGARLIYPNGFNLKPETPFDFWNYDADVKGWYIYGSGKVSDDARNIVPDHGVEIYEFTGAMVGTASGAPTNGKPKGSKANAADPVDLSTGQFIYTKTDLVLADVAPLSFTRTYITNDSRSRAFGIGATDSYDFFMVGDTVPYTFQELIQPDGGRVRFDRVSPGNSYTDSVYVASSAPGEFYGAVLSWNTDPSLPGTWKIVTKDGTILSFPESLGSTNPFCQAVVQIKDRYGNTTKIDRSNCVLQKITTPNGRYVTVTNDTSSRITQITDNSGRSVNYSYDPTGRLATVTDPNGGVTSYTYDDQNRMLTIKDPRQIVYLTNEYDGAGRVSKQTQADGGLYLFNWTPAQTAQTHFIASYGPTGGGGDSFYFRDACWGGGGYKRYDPNCAGGYMPLVAQVDVTDPRGYIRRVNFGQTGYMTSDIHALNQPEQQTVTYSYYGDNLLQSVTDSLGRVTSFDYDSQGNTTRITRLDGTPNAVTTTMSYGGPFGKLSNVTDPLGHSTTYQYDTSGNLATATDPLNHAITSTYTSGGQPALITDALNQTMQLGYFGGDSATSIDAMGNTNSQFTDQLGRAVFAMDSQQRVVQYQYNNLNLLTQITDPKGQITSFSYDANGNLLSLTDALHLQNPTTWTYDNMDRVQTRVDPLRKQESYLYDEVGNLVSATDRKNQITTFNYDPLNRLHFIGFNTSVAAGVTSYESTVTYTYDAGNRMTQAFDSAGSTINRSFDNLDRLTTETTAEGSITYEYDLAGRRTTMTVAGQPTVLYTYDEANRLTQITKGTSTFGFGYDVINRRTSLTTSDGAKVSYSYDNNSRVTGITYNFGANLLGDLTYSYDQLGRRTLVGGSFARTGLPPAVASASYDEGNELTDWNGTAITYDSNGNMLSDGTNSFVWNARNQLVALNGSNPQYDAFGRRSKNISGRSFLFDGPNETQELSGSTVLANLISGGVDEVFGQADASGSFTPLKDALGSTIALLDTNGNTQTTYSYDPFGGTTVSGEPNSNALQFTGRENDGTGLYYYRARYYNPKLHRFISPDPLRLRGGINMYAYVGDDPVNFFDPTGMDKQDVMATPCSNASLPGWWPSWAPQGGGYVAGESLVAGTGLRPSSGRGTEVTASAGIGVYSCEDISEPWVQEGAAVYNVNADGVTETCDGIPNQTCDIFHTGAAGAYLGMGQGAYLTNANSLSQQLGSFQTTQINAWLFSVELSEGNGIWVLSVTGGPGAGLSVNTLTTNTSTVNNLLFH